MSNLTSFKFEKLAVPSPVQSVPVGTSTDADAVRAREDLARKRREGDIQRNLSEFRTSRSGTVELMPENYEAYKKTNPDFRTPQEQELGRKQYATLMGPVEPVPAPPVVPVAPAPAAGPLVKPQPAAAAKTSGNPFEQYGLIRGAVNKYNSPVPGEVFDEEAWSKLPADTQRAVLKRAQDVQREWANAGYGYQNLAADNPLRRAYGHANRIVEGAYSVNPSNYKVVGPNRKPGDDITSVSPRDVSKSTAVENAANAATTGLKVEGSGVTPVLANAAIGLAGDGKKIVTPEDQKKVDEVRQRTFDPKSVWGQAAVDAASVAPFTVPLAKAGPVGAVIGAGITAGYPVYRSFNDLRKEIGGMRQGEPNATVRQGMSNLQRDIASALAGGDTVRASQLFEDARKKGFLPSTMRFEQIQAAARNHQLGQLFSAHSYATPVG